MALSATLRGGTTVSKVGYNFASEASEKFFRTPTFCIPEGHETEHVFIIVIMTYKRLSAANEIT